MYVHDELVRQLNLNDIHLRRFRHFCEMHHPLTPMRQRCAPRLPSRPAIASSTETNESVRSFGRCGNDDAAHWANYDDVEKSDEDIMPKGAFGNEITSVRDIVDDAR